MSNPVIYLLVFFGSISVLVAAWKLKSFFNISKNNKTAEKTLIEDVLKQLYHVEYSGRSASLNDMAGAMKIKHPKLVSLVETMLGLKLITTHDQVIRLTNEGRDYAVKIVRVHRLWEKYLSERTGVDKLEWHDRAEIMEHKLAPEQIEKLYDDLGRPRFDPHGDPIPTERGEIMEIPWEPLPALPEGAIARIVHIEDEPEVIYQQIIAKKLHNGSQIKITSSNESSIHFYCEGTEYVLTSIVAANIGVVHLNKMEVFNENAFRLSHLGQDEDAKILGISSECRGASRRRLLDLGFIPGSEIRSEFNSPLEDPKAYKIRNTLIALRNEQADMILIEKETA